MKMSGIAATLPAEDLNRARHFYAEKVGLHAIEPDFLVASDGRRGITVGDGAHRLMIYPATTQSSGDFTQAVLQVADVGCALEEMRSRGVRFEEYDTSDTWTENGVSRTPDGSERAWFKDSEGNLIGIVCVGKHSGLTGV